MTEQSIVSCTSQEPLEFILAGNDSECEIFLKTRKMSVNEAVSLHVKVKFQFQ